MRTVLVTGATGFVGRNIAATIRHAGMEAVAAGRSPADGPWERFIELDLRRESVPQFPRRLDAVIHAAGIAHDTTGKQFTDDHYEQVNARGAATVAEAAVAAGTKHFVLISSVKAMADSTCGAALTENSPCAPVTSYGRSKLKAERLVAERLTGTTCALTVLRLTPVYGMGTKGNLARLVRWAGRWWFPRLPEGVGGRSMVHVSDVADLTLLVLLNRVAGTMIVDDGNIYTPRAIQDALRHEGRRTSAVPIPAIPISSGLLRSALIAIDRLRDGGRSAITPSDSSRLLDEALYHGAHMRELTGFEPRRSLWSELRMETGLADRTP